MDFSTLLKELQVPGLVLAAGVIWMLFKLLGKMVDLSTQLLAQMAEHRATLSEVVGLLRQLCSTRGSKE